MAGARPEITHGMCASCLRARKSRDVIEPEMSGPRATQASRRHAAAPLHGHAAQAANLQTAQAAHRRAAHGTSEPQGDAAQSGSHSPWSEKAAQ